MSFRTIGAAHKDLKPQLQSNLPPANLIRIWTALLKFFSSFTSTILLLRVEAEGRKQHSPYANRNSFLKRVGLLDPADFFSFKRCGILDEPEGHIMVRVSMSLSSKACQRLVPQEGSSGSRLIPYFVVNRSPFL